MTEIFEEKTPQFLTDKSSINRNDEDHFSKAHQNDPRGNLWLSFCAWALHGIVLKVCFTAT